MERDPWYFQRWAFDVKVGNPVRKAVLSMLAMMADAQTGRCEAKQETLAAGVEAGERAIRGHLSTLEKMGVIARRPQFRRDRGRRGDEFLLLAPGIDEWPDGESVSRDQPAQDAGGTGTDGEDPPAQIDAFTRHETHPQEQPRRTTTSDDHATKPGEDARERPPDDFPDELRPHARHVLRVLRSVAETHGAKKVWPLRLGKLLMQNRHKPLVATAHALDQWAVDPGRPIKDVVSTYSTFLARERELEGVEPLRDDGTPGPGSLPGNVHHMRGRPMSNADRVDQQVMALRGLSSDLP